MNLTTLGSLVGKLGGALRQLSADRIEVLRQKTPSLAGINIEISYACNMKCKTCSRVANARQNYMDVQLFRKAVRELKENGFKGGLYLHYAGEPLLHPKLAEILETVNAAGFAAQTTLFSNGALLTRDRLALLKQNGIRTITVSIDGDEAYQSEYRSPQSYRKILDNLATMRREFGDFFDLTVGTTLYEQKQGTLDRLVAEVRPFANSIRITPSLDQQTMKFNPHELLRLSRYDLSCRTCPMLWCSMTVLTDGRLSACCFALDATKIIPVLNLNERNCWEAFTSPEFTAVRKDFLARKFEGPFASCANCYAWKMAGYNLPQLRIKRLTRGEIVVTNGYMDKWFLRPQARGRREMVA